MKKNTALFQHIAAMAIFGTVGLFRRWIPLSSGMLAMLRGFIGAGFLLLVRRQMPDWKAVRRNLLPLICSGAFMGANWILLFEAYNHTTVPTATLCYYMAPVFVTLASPILLKERLSWVKALCVAVALGGMVLVSGIVGVGFRFAAEGLGVAMALGAALLYACVTLTNKKLRDISGFDATVVQLLVAAVVLVPYVFFAEGAHWAAMDWTGYAALAVVCLVITGLAYQLYFGSLQFIPAQTAAVLGYIDPVVAVLLSWVFLGESLGALGIVGAVLIVGATLCSQLFGE